MLDNSVEKKHWQSTRNETLNEVKLKVKRVDNNCD